MLLELCVTELEDVATDSQSGRLSSQPVVVESSHPYTDDTSTSGTVKIPGMWASPGEAVRSPVCRRLALQLPPQGQPFPSCEKQEIGSFQIFSRNLCQIKCNTEATLY